MSEEVELELEVDEDGVLRLHEQKPVLGIEFSSEEALIEWLSDASNKKLLPEGVRFCFDGLKAM